MPSSKKKLRSRCPVGFEAVSLKESQESECPVLEDVLSDDSSLWLIKVPHDFDLSSLSGQNVVLNGSQDLRSNSAQDTGKRYEVQSKTDGSAESMQLSSFTVVLPSLQKKSLRAAGSISGQMSIIRSVSVPPPTLPESSLSVQRQTPNQVIRKWKPFGYRKPRQKHEPNKVEEDAPVKEKKTKEPKESPKDGSRKHTKERKGTDLEESMNSEAKGKKNDTPKKKITGEATHEVDLTRVKIEPDEDGSSQMTARNGGHSSDSPRKRKAELLSERQQNSEDLALSTSKKKKKSSKSESVDTIVKHEPVTPVKNLPRHAKHQDADTDEGEVISLKQKKINSEKEKDFDLARVKTEPKESHKKKKKHSKTKTC